ncbi:MAG TPA: prepilin-type N-terminal cleavage/methylation domain-containing protein [Burkholderiales bacterium]|nr:prepilin-type N-terminal cleavage/methylation domain-containing protein [Burkholderiales bacterium]
MNRKSSQGFTLIEIAIVLVIIGLLLGGILKGQELITSARVRNLISQQDGVKAAFFGFQDRFRAFPGDYTAATTNIVGVSTTSGCGGAVNGNGNGNGRVESAAGGLYENVLAWEQLSKAGFITGTYTCATTEAPATSPVNPYGVYMQVVFDGIYGAGTTATPAPLRHNIKSGSQVPVDIIAEMDRKIDDGAPNTGGFQFSRYQGNGAAAPTDGAAAQPACTSATTAAGIWNTTNGSTNCGGASLL